jgi:hypothetical protein
MKRVRGSREEHEAGGRAAELHHYHTIKGRRISFKNVDIKVAYGSK